MSGHDWQHAVLGELGVSGAGLATPESPNPASAPPPQIPAPAPAPDAAPAAAPTGPARLPAPMPPLAPAGVEPRAVEPPAVEPSSDRRVYSPPPPDAAPQAEVPPPPPGRPAADPPVPPAAQAASPPAPPVPAEGPSWYGTGSGENAVPGSGDTGMPPVTPATEIAEPSGASGGPLSPATSWSQPAEDRNFLTSELDHALFSAAIEYGAGAPAAQPAQGAATGEADSAPAAPPPSGHPGVQYGHPGGQYGGDQRQAPPGTPSMAWPPGTGAPPEAPPGSGEPPAGNEPPGSNDLVRRNVHGDPLMRRVGQGVRRAMGGSAAHDVRQQAAMIERIRQQMPSCRQIAVTSIRGGAGKTTVSALVARAIADFRGDRVLAVDADPGLGSLPLRLGAQAERSLHDLAQVRLNSLEEAGLYLGRSAERLWVLPGSTAGTMSADLDVDTFRAAMGNLTRYFSAAVIDCGAGIGELQRGILSGVHGQVMVAQGTADGAYSTQSTVDWLAANGYGALLARTVIVLVTHSPHVDSDLERAQQMLSAAGLPVVHVPYDRQLATGATIDVTRISSGSRAATTRIAAEVLARAATG